MQFTNRYEALGMPLPDPATMCHGYCEGTGWVPVYQHRGDSRPDPNQARPTDCDQPELIAAWNAAEAAEPAGDGWHFVQCPACEGTGKNSEGNNPMTRLVFLDTETTSLRPDRRAWEIGLIIRDVVQQGDKITHVDTDRAWFITKEDLDLGNADPMSLKIGRFYERHPDMGGRGSLHPERNVLRQVEELTRGATIVGAVPNFDTEVLGSRMRAHGICPSWHYHLVDVETLAAGALRKPPPWGFDDLLALFGLTYDEKDRHTALGDSGMARDLYDAVMTGPRS